MRYAPVSLLTAVVVTPVSTFVAVTSTPGISAPLLSSAVPVRTAFAVWPKANAPKHPITIATITSLFIKRLSFTIVPSFDQIETKPENL
jgi:hypothetical protein